MSDPISRKVRIAELLSAALLGCMVVAYFQLPHVWALRSDRLQHNPGWVYFGGLNTYADEAAVYLAWMRQGRDGRFFFTDLYTPEPHPRNFVNVLWLGLGMLSRFTGTEPVTIYSGARIVLGLSLVGLLYLLSRYLFHRPGERIGCLFMMVVASGWEGVANFLERNFGWAHVSSPGWWMPEISTTYSMMLFPQFLAGFCAMVGAVILMMRAWEPTDTTGRRSVRAACAAGAVMFVLTFFHPYDVVPLVGMLGIAPLLFALAERRLPWREIRIALVALLVWLPAFVYNLVIFQTNPAMRFWDLQNIMRTPELNKVIFCMGIGGLLAVVGAAAAWRAGRRHLVMSAWLIATMIIIYLPIRFQRRCMGGMQIPVAALAATAIVFVVAPWLKRLVVASRWGRALTDRHALLRRGMGLTALAVVALLAPIQVLTPFYLQGLEWRSLRRVRHPAWLRVEFLDALRALEKTAAPDSVVLASYSAGNLVPPFTGLRCFLGHYALTMDSDSKKVDAARFFSAGGDDDPWRLELLERFGVDYVLDTPFERELGDFDPATRSWLEAVYSAGDDPKTRATVYAVRLTAADDKKNRDD